MRETELLIPAGSLDVLKTAVIFGADAVYIGGEAFGLRAKAHNFSRNDMKEGIAFAHARGVKVYVTANILAHNGDLPGVEAYFEELKEIGPDALIISDPGVFAVAKKVLPGMEIHISTQANNTNYGTYLFWHKLGARRELYPWGYVHFLFRALPAEQLLCGQGRQPGRLHPSLPVEIFHCGGNQARRIYAGI